MPNGRPEVNHQELFVSRKHPSPARSYLRRIVFARHRANFLKAAWQSWCSTIGSTISSTISIDKLVYACSHLTMTFFGRLIDLSSVPAAPWRYRPVKDFPHVRSFHHPCRNVADAVGLFPLEIVG
jgi:hypothetical protein